MNELLYMLLHLVPSILQIRNFNGGKKVRTVNYRTVFGVVL